jgi:hypothetical protein
MSSNSQSQKVRFQKGIGMVAAALFLAACGTGGESIPEPVAASCMGQPALLVRGPITTDTVWTADQRYVLSGRVDVTNRATLTIQPGTVLCGDAEQGMMNVSYLNVDQDARLVADGSADRPIVFTSSRPPGQRRPQDWGGVVLRGRAPINNPPDTGKGPETTCAQAEASAGSYGPCGTPRPEDDSGILRYVRIEFAGREFAPDKELNALTLYAIGSRTTLDYVQVHKGSDDGIEIFGGTVNVKHAVATACQDDSFDWEFGWTGKGQFWVATQERNIGNRGFESDNNRMNAALLPRSNPTISNVTLLGLGRGVMPGGSDKREGLSFRSGSNGSLSNFLVVGFSDVGVSFEEATLPQLAEGKLALVQSWFWNNGPAGDAKNISDVKKVGATDFDVREWVLGQKGSREEDPQIEDGFNPTAPRFTLRAGSPALTSGVVPSDGFFTQVAYVGAFGTEDWTAGWTAFPQN